MPASPGLRYLAAADVMALMPPVGQRIELARRAMVALVADADLPAKIGVHARPDGSFGHAMPAFLRGADPAGAQDLLGLKWVVGFPTNGARGLPAIHGSVLLNDPHSGVPRAILDAAPITAHRTAAVSGVCLSAWSPASGGGPLRVAMLGAGVQARSHLPVVGHLLPGSALTIHDRHPERATELVDEATRSGWFASAGAAEGAAAAVEGADVVVSMVSFGPQRQQLPAEAFESASLVVAVDYDMCLPARVAAGADLFLVDELGQFRANRDSGIFAGYPDPAGIIGQALVHEWPRPAGRVVVTHLGVGLADLVFADAILRQAEVQGMGTVLAS
jgi:ornithine cyclodeaminase/alanine dehydrogenase-like protein (mu-crystallin family)